MTQQIKTVKVYSTTAECFRDFHEFYDALLKQTGTRIGPDIQHYPGSSMCAVTFIVHSRFEDKCNENTIKVAIDSVADAQDMNEFMIVETFEFPENWWEINRDADPSTAENIRKYYKRVSKKYFCKMFDDVYDVIECGAMRVEEAV
jgi:hypothetical protein